MHATLRFQFLSATYMPTYARPSRRMNWVQNFQFSLFSDFVCRYIMKCLYSLDRLIFRVATIVSILGEIDYQAVAVLLILQLDHGLCFP